jgi:hypothetical protein
MKLLTVSIPAMLLFTLFTGRAPINDIVSEKSSITGIDPKTASPGLSAVAEEHYAIDLYDKFRLETRGLSRESFLMAMQGYRELRKMGRLRNPDVLTIIDYTVSSLHRRLFVLDIKSGRLLYNTYVSHGMKSGKEYARRFSNTPESMESSLGFYVTMNTYTGKHGLALRLKGMERGINDNALRRGIVLHGAGYVNEHYCRRLGFMGRSEGCPAVPEGEAAPIIRSIRNGSAVFVYYPSQLYLGKSRLLANNSKTLASR